MTNYRITYRYKNMSDSPKMVIVIAADSEAHAREKFQQDIFKNFEIVSIEETL